jgi:flagellar motor switch protein FliN/FliY
MTEDKDIEMSGEEDAVSENSQDQQEVAVDAAPEDSPADIEEPKAGAENESDLSVEPDEAEADNSEFDGAESSEVEDFKIVNEDDASEGDAEAEMLKMLEGLPDEESGATPDDINLGSAPVSGAEFQQLQQSSDIGEPRNIDLLMDVDLPVSIELGRTKMPISDLLALGPGSVVELNKLAGEPADLLINYKVVARGEVVVIDENFGLRITQLMTPEERLKALAND